MFAASKFVPTQIMQFAVTALLFASAAVPRALRAQPVQPAPAAVLHPSDYAHYVATFRDQEREATGKVYEGEGSEDTWAWMQQNIPFFDSSDKSFEAMYYFRWYAWKKHLVHTTNGWLITEWLPKPNLADLGALPDAAGFHIAEARWLRNPAIAEDDARYWFSPGADSHKYSDAMAAAVRDLTLANGDRSFAISLLPSMLANYKLWESTQQDPNGLFWSIDTRDAMEKSISGDGYRPTLNSYMVGDALAIADIAADSGDARTSAEYLRKAATLSGLIETTLWNPKDQFYEVMSPSADSGIRRQKRFADNGTTMQLAAVREQIGYIPWMYYAPGKRGEEVAWKQLFDPQGFDATYGTLTAERRSPRFRFPSSDQCTWNGPAWPFATTQTLTALANYLDTPTVPKTPHVLTSADYYTLFSRYVLAQHRVLDNGHTIDWIDEDLDADTDEWLARDILIAKHSPQVGRGNYYNHSGFADPLITGLIGLRPRVGNRIDLRPLLPPGEWSYFAIDALPYHNHLLTILWDPTGSRYRHGKGLTLLVDGKFAASRPALGPLGYQLKQ